MVNYDQFLFRTALHYLNDCYSNMDTELSGDEEVARIWLIKMCEEIVETNGWDYDSDSVEELDMRGRVSFSPEPPLDKGEHHFSRMIGNSYWLYQDDEVPSLEGRDGDKVLGI